jgi:ABC-2 type transport system ATP-binding protein
VSDSLRESRRHENEIKSSICEERRTLLDHRKTVHNRAMTQLTQRPSTESPHPALRVAGLIKHYPGVTALDDVSFTVERGEIVGLLGPNGAGKTTTINVILGVLEPTAGEVTIDSIDIAKARSLALTRANFAAVYAALPGNLTVTQNLRFFGLLYSIDALTSRVDELLDEFDLRHLRDTRCGLLSSGEQTRAALAKALINRPSLLLLDEPTASLDPSAARIIRERIRRLAKQERCGILWTSHNMLEVQAVCDRVLFLARGKVLLEGDPNTLPQERGADSLEELFIRVAREPGASSHVT